MKFKWGLALALGILLGMEARPAEAARSYTISQTNPASGSDVLMGSTVPVTFRITNTANGGNAGERIYEMRFRISSGSTFASTTAAPAGWTRTAYSTTSVTFQATSWANAIASGASMDFTLTIVMRRTSADVSETLRDARARFTTTTSGPPFSRLASITVNNPGSWRLKSLQAVFRITDLSGNLITSIKAGDSFRVIITVTNWSSSSQSSIVVGNSGNRPVANITPTVTLNSPTPTYSPNPLTLAAGATGTITFTYTTQTSDSGTVYFTAFVRNSGNTATSTTVQSITLSVTRFSASLSIDQLCLYNLQNLQVTMTLTNGFTNNIVVSAAPTLTPSAGAPVVANPGLTTLLPVTVPAGGTATVRWTYQVNGGNVGDQFWFTGSASGTEQTAGNPTRSTLPSNSLNATRAGFTTTIAPSTTNASSTNQELSWSFTNQGCNKVNEVRLSIPNGWSWGGDAYSLVQNGAVFLESWTFAQSGNTVIFTAPAGGEMIIGGSGDFRLVFTATPAAPETSTFDRTIFDIDGDSALLNMSYTVNAFNTGGLNQTGTTTYREDFR